MIGILRVKNEARWIARVLGSIASVCRMVIVLDDHSTDDTPGICQSAGAFVMESPYEGLDESRDKDLLLAAAYEHAQPREMVLCIDGDEMLHPEDRLHLADDLPADCYSLRVLYLWDREDRVRVDGVYSGFRRPSLFRLYKPGLSFRRTDAAGNFHCGNVPGPLVHASRPLPARLLHFGYMLRPDRIRKYDWYRSIDGGNANEDGYRHMVIGDVFPADSKFRHGGPLEVRAL